MALSGIALVTGGAGFIGSHIASALLASGARVRVLDDLSTGHRENIDEIGGDIDFVEGSVADEELLNKRSKASRWFFTRLRFRLFRVRLKLHDRRTSPQLTARFLC